MSPPAKKRGLLPRDPDHAPWTTKLDQRFRRNRKLRTLARKICDLQDELRARVTDEAWTVYLRIEEACTQRLCIAVDQPRGLG